MKISRFGIGNIGAAPEVCPTDFGPEVVCVEVRPARAGLIHRGPPRIVARGVADRIVPARAEGRTGAATDAPGAFQPRRLDRTAYGLKARAHRARRASFEAVDGVRAGRGAGWASICIIGHVGGKFMDLQGVAAVQYLPRVDHEGICW